MQRAVEAIVSVLVQSLRRSARTLRVVPTPHGIRPASERWFVALFLLVFAAGVVLAAVQAARLSLAIAFGA